MKFWQRWMQRPRSLWVRKAFFQVHLWAGLGVGLYILAIGVSGSAIVYRRELTSRYSRKIIVVSDLRLHLLSVDELEQIAQREYPAYEVLNIVEPGSRNQPDHVVLERRDKRIVRLFDPYTGADLGDPRSGVDRAVRWLVDFHDNLLSGQTGRLVNGLGAFFVTLLSLTGAIIWWPGVRKWRRSATVLWKANFARVNWGLHSAIGIWCSLFVFLWGISGIYLCFRGGLSSLGDGQFLYWIAQLHFGRFNGFTKPLWTIAGLAPAVLFVTGALMWWNRVLRHKIRFSE